MFNRKTKTKAKTRTLNATCVLPLSESNVRLLKLMQFNHTPPAGAKYVAFLEDGEACYLSEIARTKRPGEMFTLPPMPYMALVTYYEDIQVEFED